MSDIFRIDPKGCGCTECALGESKPIDLCTTQELLLCACGEISNSSMCKIEIKPALYVDGEFYDHF